MTGGRFIVASVVLASTITGCHQAPQHEAAPNTIAPNAAAPAPAPTPSAAPAPPPSPKSIMQPTVTQEPVLPPPLVPISGTVGFPNGGATLDQAAKDELDKLAGDPATAAGGPVILRGATDSSGSDADNLAMSRRRALAVATYLEGKSVDRDRIQIVALGEGRPVAPDRNLDGSDNPAGRAKNRRVDVEIDLPNKSETPETPTTSEPCGSPRPKCLKTLP